MLMVILITIAAIFLFYYYIVKPYDYWKDRGVKQGNPVWILGDNWRTFFGKQNVVEMMQDIYYKCPGVRYSGMYQCFLPILVVKDLDLIKRIAIKDFHHFTDHRSFFPEDVDSLWGKNLFSLKGEKWRDMRTILSPSFTSSKMRAMFVLMLQCAENFVQYFLMKNEDVLTIEFKDVFTRFTNDVIASTAFGIQVDSLNQSKNNFYMMGKETTDIHSTWKFLKIFAYILFPKICKLMKISLFSKEVGQFFEQIVSDTIKMREEKGIVRADMINVMLEARKGIQKQEEKGVIETEFSTAPESDLGKNDKLPRGITDMDITSQAMIFFFAGFESVSGLMCFVAYELTANPDIQDRLREEVRSTFEECGGKVTYDGLLKMKYMDMVISETLRKWPNTIGVDRLCTKPYTIEATRPNEKPLRLEKGDIVWLPIYNTHHNPEYFPNPDRFDPERFSKENRGNIKPYTYFPFGLGPRNCIGLKFALLETKIIIFYILKHFELVPVEKSVIPLQIAKKQFTLNSESGFWFGLKRISV